MMNNYLFFVQNKNKKEDTMNTLYKIALTIGIISCINCGLVGLFNFNLVEYLFGDNSLITRIVYTLVFVSGLIEIGIFTKDLD